MCNMTMLVCLMNTIMYKNRTADQLNLFFIQTTKNVTHSLEDLGDKSLTIFVACNLLMMVMIEYKL